MFPLGMMMKQLTNKIYNLIYISTGNIYRKNIGDGLKGSKDVTNEITMSNQFCIDYSKTGDKLLFITSDLYSGNNYFYKKEGQEQGVLTLIKTFLSDMEFFYIVDSGLISKDGQYIYYGTTTTVLDSYDEYFMINRINYSDGDGLQLIFMGDTNYYGRLVGIFDNGDLCISYNSDLYRKNLDGGNLGNVYSLGTFIVSGNRHNGNVGISGDTMVYARTDNRIYKKSVLDDDIGIPITPVDYYNGRTSQIQLLPNGLMYYSRALDNKIYLKNINDGDSNYPGDFIINGHSVNYVEGFTVENEPDTPMSPGEVQLISRDINRSFSLNVGCQAYQTYNLFVINKVGQINVEFSHNLSTIYTTSNTSFDLYHNGGLIYNGSSSYNSGTTNSGNIVRDVNPGDTISVRIRSCSGALNNSGTAFCTTRLKGNYLDEGFASSI